MSVAMKDELTRALSQHFGFTAFRPYQREIVDAAVEGKHVLGVLPTGAGKSLTFQLPALLGDGLTLVVSPLVALMEDQVRQLGQRGIAAACITARTSSGEFLSILDEVRSGNCRLLYVAPERLASPRFQEVLRTLKVRLLAVDEAHCVSEWGHNFRPDYRRIRDARDCVPDATVMALTATATPTVRRDIINNLGLRGAVQVVGDFDRPNLEWHVRKTATTHRLTAIEELLSEITDGSAIVYAPSRNLTEKIASALQARGVAADCYHAGLASDLREQRQVAFQEGRIRVMVATVAFGMGVHKDDVRLVVHYSMPRSLEAYYQEAGRAGRDNRPARCVLLYSRSDLRYLHQRIEDAYPDRDVLRQVQLAAVRGELQSFAVSSDIPQDTVALALSGLLENEYLRGNGVDGFAAGKGGDQGARALEWLDRHRRSEFNRLYAVRDYAEAEGCRSEVLLRWFGQDGGACGHCDTCLGISPAAATGATRKKAVPQVVPGWTAENQAGFERLRAWRYELASQWNVPAFHVMNDKVLKEVARVLPIDQETFVSISGLGPKKWEAFGHDLTAFIASELC